MRSSLSSLLIENIKVWILVAGKIISTDKFLLVALGMVDLHRFSFEFSLMNCGLHGVKEFGRKTALQDICDYNDISEEQLVSAPETITSIEMFLYNFPHICCMSFFPNLVSLSLVQQNLLSIEGLHYCPHLELLRLSENIIQR